MRSAATLVSILFLTILSTSWVTEVLPSTTHNKMTTLILSGTDGIITADCTLDFDCVTSFPTTDVSGFGFVTANFVLRNYDTVNGVQAAFDWPPEWLFAFGFWQCQEGQLTAVVPTAPGPFTGTIATVFNPISGGEVELIGALVFVQATGGCLDILESAFDLGTTVVDTTGDEATATPIPPEHWGRLCVGPGGLDLCEPPSTPVKSSTWGGIKSQYRR